MRNLHGIAGSLIAAVVTLTSFATLARAQSRTQMTIDASGVTVVGNTALVLVELARAIVVPYRPR